MSDRPRIVLGEEDFVDLGADSGVASLEVPTVPGSTVALPASIPPSTIGADGPANSQLPAVSRGVPRRLDAVEDRALAGAPVDGSGVASNWLRSPSRAPLVAAGAGVLLAWAVTEVLGLPDITYHGNIGGDAVTALWTGVVGLLFGGTLLAFDSAVAGAWEVAARRFARAAAPMFAVSFGAGWIANLAYQKLAQDALERELRSGHLSKNNAELYLARGLGWALFGVGVGVTVGLITRSNKRAVNGALGGALGGLAGGLVFEFVATNFGVGVSMSRLLGLAAIGGLIALATRAIEVARREAWLQVVAGGMVGKEFILYHAITRLGASPDCEIFLLKDPAVEKLHAKIADSGTQRTLQAVTGAVLVNGTSVGTYVLKSGDHVQIGKTVIAYSERAFSSAVPGQ